MKAFQDLYEIAAKRKGGSKALEVLIPKPASTSRLKAIPDDRWLSAMTKSVFQAGFNWRVVENKWEGFEQAFEGFDPVSIAIWSDEKLDQLATDRRVIRQWRKLKATRDNAVFLSQVIQEHGSVGRYFTSFPRTRYIELLKDLGSRASWMGGTSAQYFLRTMGKDAFILSRDVVTALKREKVITGSPNSQKSMKAVQSAFDHWCRDGGKNLTRVSRVLAMTVE